MYQSTSSRRQQQGFTLMEVLIVVVIIGILASIAAVNLLGEEDAAKRTKAQADIGALTSAMDLYKLHNGHYPSTDQGLDALVTRPSGQPDAQNWKQGGYLRSGLPKDPWGRDYLFLNPGFRSAIDIYTLGADGLEGGEAENADIGNWAP